jgi:hypothetical protein
VILEIASTTAPSRVSEVDRAIRWASTSVSVSERSVTPALLRCCRSAVALSMIPLCTTEIRPSSEVCGCALSWVAGPCVAHRVCPIPTFPPSRFGSVAVRSRTRPTVRCTCAPAPPSTAMPAESYPRYSSRVSPSTRIGAAFWLPTYPTIPHMRAPQP